MGGCVLTGNIGTLGPSPLPSCFWPPRSKQDSVSKTDLKQLWNATFETEFPNSPSLLSATGPGSSVTRTAAALGWSGTQLHIFAHG